MGDLQCDQTAEAKTLAHPLIFAFPLVMSKLNLIFRLSFQLMKISYIISGRNKRLCYPFNSHIQHWFEHMAFCGALWSLHASSGPCLPEACNLIGKATHSKCTHTLGKQPPKVVYIEEQSWVDKRADSEPHSLNSSPGFTDLRPGVNYLIFYVSVLTTVLTSPDYMINNWIKNNLDQCWVHSRHSA